MKQVSRFMLFLSKEEIQSIITSLRASPDWTMSDRQPIITKLERRLRQISSEEIERAKYNGPDYPVGI